MSCTSTNSEDEQEQRIVLHVYDDESRDFTDLTTYHGMRRIYSSATWPSRIFWSLVVVTCLSLFMIHSGLMLFFYNAHPTFFKTFDVPMASKFLPTVTFCKSRIDIEETYRLAYQIINDIPLGKKDLYVLQTVSASKGLEHYLNSSRMICDQDVKAVYIGKRKIPDHCIYFTNTITDIGYCVSFQFQELSDEPTHAVEVEFFQKENASVSFQVHSYGSHSNMVSKRRFLRKSYRSIIAAKISNEFLLHQNDWGTCHNEFEGLHFADQPYQRRVCEKNCIAKQYIESCSCVPFYLAGPKVKVCSLAEMFYCKQTNRPTQSCDCPIECERLIYTISDPSLVKLKENKSVFHLEFPSHKVLTHYQLKRIKAVDLLKTLFRFRRRQYGSVPRYELCHLVRDLYLSFQVHLGSVQ